MRRSGVLLAAAQTTLRPTRAAPLFAVLVPRRHRSSSFVHKAGSGTFVAAVIAARNGSVTVSISDVAAGVCRKELEMDSQLIDPT